MSHQRILIAVGIVAPRSFAELIDAHDPAGVSAERRQNIMFLCSKRKNDASAVHLRPLQVDFPAGDVENRIFPAVIPLQTVFRPQQKLLRKNPSP